MFVDWRNGNNLTMTGRNKYPDCLWKTSAACFFGRNRLGLLAVNGPAAFSPLPLYSGVVKVNPLRHFDSPSGFFALAPPFCFLKMSLARSFFFSSCSLASRDAIGEPAVA